MAVYVGSVMGNSVSNTEIIECSKRNESYRNWLVVSVLVLFITYLLTYSMVQSPS